MTPEERQIMCPLVFGAHAWEWGETPVLSTFESVPPYRHLHDDYMRVCRVCEKVQIFEVAPPPRID